MALLQRSCLSYCSPVASTVTFTTLQSRRALVQLSRSPRQVSICCASPSSRNRSPADTDEAPVVYKDDSTGVVCYTDEKGDVTCEGWDEGPHFQPDPQQPTLRRRRFTASAGQSRRGVETEEFEIVKGRMGESLGEVANESLESSEL